MPWLARELGTLSEIEHTFETRIGNRDYEVRLKRMLDVSDKFSGTVAILNDITDRKRSAERLEQLVQERTDELREKDHQLAQAQRMEAIGRLAAGVAHDFNNLLTAISGYSQLLMMELPEDSPLRKEVEEISDAGDRAAALTGQLLAFSRKQALKLTAVDVKEVVTNVEKMLRRVIGEDIDLVIEQGETAGPIMADRGQIEQVLMNLSVNARDAMKRGGRLTIRTANVEIATDRPVHQSILKTGGYTLIHVQDTGTGIESKHLERIFEPFYSTKEAGKGTGLGLSTVYGIVKQFGGQIEVASEIGKGTAFSIFLPRLKEPVEAPGAEPKAPDTLEGSETVLLVEDEAGVRDLVARILKIYGYTVVTASSGEEALALCGEHKGRIDLVITDVVMPGLSGQQLVKKLAEERPGVKVIYMSGYTDSGVLRRGIVEKQAVMLQKPFAPATLCKKVREALST
jgi:signal transduction histidine kinase